MEAERHEVILCSDQVPDQAPQTLEALHALAQEADDSRDPVVIMIREVTREQHHFQAAHKLEHGLLQRRTALAHLLQSPDQIDVLLFLHGRRHTQALVDLVLLIAKMHV